MADIDLNVSTSFGAQTEAQATRSDRRLEKIHRTLENMKKMKYGHTEPDDVPTRADAIAVLELLFAPEKGISLEDVTDIAIVASGHCGKPIVGLTAAKSDRTVSLEIPCGGVVRLKVFLNHEEPRNPTFECTFQFEDAESFGFQTIKKICEHWLKGK